MSVLDLGIDLGTANIIITTGRGGAVLNEPTVISADEPAVAVGAVIHLYTPFQSRSRVRLFIY